MSAIGTIELGTEPPAPAVPNSEIHNHADALTEVLARYSHVLYGIAYRKLGNAEDAEDALQDALLSAFKNMDQFRGQSRLSTWLTSIVLNSAKMQLRRRLYHNFVSLDENPQAENGAWVDILRDSAPDAENTLQRAQHHETLERLAERLPAGTRAAFRLRVFKGLSTCEAAAVLGIPQSALKARFFRARKQVTRLMRKAVRPPRKSRDNGVNVSRRG